jgi:hypothetical protein
MTNEQRFDCPELGFYNMTDAEMVASLQADAAKGDAYAAACLRARGIKPEGRACEAPSAEHEEPGRDSDAPNNRSTPGSAPTGEALTDALGALERAQQFISNGRALGYIRMPDADCPDPAHQTPGIIDAAIENIRAALATHPSAPVAPTEDAEPLPMARYDLNQGTARMEESPSGRWVFYNAVRAAPAQPVAPTVDLLKGWKLNHIQFVRGSGKAEIGYLDEEDDRFSPIVTIDTGLYYRPDDAVPLAHAILEALATHPPAVQPADALKLLQEMVDLCALGDIDEDTDDGLGWAGLVRDAKALLAATPSAEAQPTPKDAA